jgi:signal transduction histidine kinase
MSTGFRRLLRSQPGRSVVLLFAVTILIPAVILTAFSLRVVEQDRELAVNRLEQNLERASRLLAELIDRELGGAETALKRAAATGVVNPGDLPEWIKEAAAVSGRLAIAIPGRAVWPEHGVAYLPWTPPVEVQEDSRVTTAAALNARAQQLRHGSPREAHSLFEELASLGTRESVASLPTALVGRYGMCATTPPADRVRCAAELHAALARGDWLLEKPRYLFYVSEAAKWIGNSASAENRALDHRRRELAEALSAGGEGGGAVVVIHAQPSPEMSASAVGGLRPVVLGIRRDWLHDHWFPGLAARIDRDIRARLVEDDELELFSGDGDGMFRVTRHTLGDRHWRMVLTHRDMDEALAAGVRARRTNLALLGCVVLLLASGTYFTGRILRRELEIGRMQSDFVSAVSHEFRSPLTGIRQLSELLVRDRVPSEERRRQYYGRIAEESDRLARVVDNILDFSAMESGRKQLQVQPIDTAAWLRGLAERHRLRLGDDAARLEVQIAELDAVMGDVEALSTAVDNLLDNAIKYSPHGGSIALRADQRGSRIAITVQDSGIGIASRDRPHIFERFYRGTADAAGVARGTGIGLSLVDQIVRAHQGRVEVVSQAGHGSTFTIVLPAHAPREAP